MTTKRSWKLQEFVAHGAAVNCLDLGPKSGRVMATGGDDKKVNMWAVGKPNCIMSFSGQSTPVECVRFNSEEELLAAGSQSGTIKVWDLEAAKIVRTLTGHKSNVKGLDFHPYGDFVASCAADSSIKLWDIRRKGCIYTYSGHRGPVNCIEFSPDGRWLVSGGDDNAIRLWDLAAGKQLHEFKGHTGAVSGIEFHPHEFLLASGSADKTVKFWDLETFKMASSTLPIANEVRCILFNPDGSSLFSASQDAMHVFGWEPAVCYDIFPMGWAKVVSMSSSCSQLIGASFNQTNVSLFVVDMNRVKTSGSVNYLPGSQDAKQTSQTQPAPPSATGRKTSITDRPRTTSTKQKAPEVKLEPQRQSPTEDDEREHLNSSAEIRDQAKYEEIFSPKHKIKASPFPAPADEVNLGTAAPTAPRLAPASQEPSSTPSAPDHSRKTVPPATAIVPTNQAPKTPSIPPHQSHQPPPLPEAHTLIPSDRNKPIGLDMNAFLPSQFQGASEAPVEPRSQNEAGQLESLRKGHNSMCALLTSRHHNLDVIRAIWTSGDAKTSIESAINMKDQAIVVDILNILNLRKSLWTLDISVIVLPRLKDLLTSKYENYVLTSCSSLKIILISFSSLIKQNIKLPRSGVDFSREERYNKCSKCYNYLLAIRGIVEERQNIVGKLGSTFRELQLLLNQLD